MHSHISICVHKNYIIQELGCNFDFGTYLGVYLENKPGRRRTGSSTCIFPPTFACWPGRIAYKLKQVISREILLA